MPEFTITFTRRPDGYIELSSNFIHGVQCGYEELLPGGFHLRTVHVGQQFSGHGTSTKRTISHCDPTVVFWPVTLRNMKMKELFESHAASIDDVLRGLSGSFSFTPTKGEQHKLLDFVNARSVLSFGRRQLVSS